MMRITNYFFLLAFLFSGAAFSQQAQVDYQADPLIKDLLNLKSEMTAKNELGGRYSIQLGSFNSLEKAKEIKRDFDTEFRHLPSRVKYESPNYKVWIGNFTSRLAAERVFLKVKEQFKSAFVFQPTP